MNPGGEKKEGPYHILSPVPPNILKAGSGTLPALPPKKVRQ